MAGEGGLAGGGNADGSGRVRRMQLAHGSGGGGGAAAAAAAAGGGDEEVVDLTCV